MVYDIKGAGLNLFNLNDDKNPFVIIDKAILQYKPIKTLLMFSGGYDSLCSTHLAANYLKSLSIPFEVYHGNTGIGLKESQDYVEKVCNLFGWNLSPNQLDLFMCAGCEIKHR